MSARLRGVTFRTVVPVGTWAGWTPVAHRGELIGYVARLSRETHQWVAMPTSGPPAAAQVFTSRADAGDHLARNVVTADQLAEIRRAGLTPSDPPSS